MSTQEGGGRSSCSFVGVRFGWSEMPSQHVGEEDDNLHIFFFGDFLREKIEREIRDWGGGLHFGELVFIRWRVAGGEGKLPVWL
jgi:hypothetical protein